MAEPEPGSALLGEQLAYYRARAPEYDDWWLRRGRFDRGEELNAAWRSDLAEVERSLAAFLAATCPGRALELACGTGLYTRLLASRVGQLTAVDGSPEVLALNRARMEGRGTPLPDYVEADLFAWSPTERYDLVFMSFWLSHVPKARLPGFWAMVRGALAPGGTAYVIDSAWEPTSHAVDHATPDRDSGVATRRLGDGREFRVVKVFWKPDDLNAQFAVLGFDATIAQTPRYFIHGPARPRPGYSLP